MTPLVSMSASGLIAFVAEEAIRLGRLSSELEDAMDTIAHEAITTIQDHMTFTQGDSTGLLESSLSATRTGPLEWRIDAGQPYAAFVEYGTGRRGAQSGVTPQGGYSYGSSPGMSAEPYMGPSLPEILDELSSHLERVLIASIAYQPPLEDGPTT